MGYIYIIRTVQQQGKEKHWDRLLWLTSPIINPKEKGKENNIYDSTCYFSPVGIDVGDVFVRRICLAKDEQSCLF